MSIYSHELLIHVKTMDTIVGPRRQPHPTRAVYVFDDPLTEGPDPNSTVIGNTRGLYASISCGSGLTILFNGDLEFTSGEFNGSSISVATRDPLVLLKEMAIVGGRGKFRMAKGFIFKGQSIHSDTQSVYLDTICLV
ncbi:putative dirigent protein [Helianthus anomalus]